MKYKIKLCFNKFDNLYCAKNKPIDLGERDFAGFPEPRIFDNARLLLELGRIQREGKFKEINKYICNK